MEWHGYKAWNEECGWRIYKEAVREFVDMEEGRWWEDGVYLGHDASKGVPSETLTIVARRG